MASLTGAQGEQDLKVVAHLFVEGSRAPFPLQSRAFLGRQIASILTNHHCGGKFGVISDKPSQGGGVLINVVSKDVRDKILGITNLKLNDVCIIFSPLTSGGPGPSQIRNRVGILFVPNDIGTIEEIKDELGENGNVGGVWSLKDFRARNSKKNPVGNDTNASSNTTPFVIEFQSDVTFPLRLSLWGALVSCKQYVPPPLRCHKCQAFGHSFANCFRGFRCLICSEKHPLDSCPQKLVDRKSQKPLCTNCKQQHVASDPQCPVFQNRVSIMKVAYTKNVPFSAAADEINKHKGPSTYAQAVSSGFPPLPQQLPIPDMTFQDKDSVIRALQNELMSLTSTVSALVQAIARLRPNDQVVKDLCAESIRISASAHMVAKNFSSNSSGPRSEEMAADQSAGKKRQSDELERSPSGTNQSKAKKG